MGGPKKPTLTKAAEKLEKGKESPAEQKKEPPAEKKIWKIEPPPETDIATYVRSQKFLTPFSLSERYGIRLSIAKDLLRRFHSQGVIKRVAGTNRISIYAPVELLQVAQSEAAVEVAAQTKQKGKKKKPS